MKELQDFDRTFFATDAEILSEIEGLPDGEPLSEEGAAKFFYATISSAGEVILLQEGERYCIFYADHDDVIQDIVASKRLVHREENNEKTFMAIVANEGSMEYTIPLTFLQGRLQHRETLKLIEEKGYLRLCLLSIAFGKYVKDSIIEIPVE